MTTVLKMVPATAPGQAAEEEGPSTTSLLPPAAPGRAAAQRPLPAPAVLVLVDQPSDWPHMDPRCGVMSAAQFLARPLDPAHTAELVINLCRSYKYLSVGYYCSLMAEARGQQVLPSVKTINDLSRKAIYSLDTSELNLALNALLDEDNSRPMPVEFSMDIHFGETDYTPLAALARHIFDTFPTPLMRVEFERDDTEWQIAGIKVQSLGTLNERQRAACGAALRRFQGMAQPTVPAPRRYRYHIAILHDPHEALPPSNPAALANFVSAGRTLGIDVSLIEKADFSRLGEFDALLIRETTAINHHTYLFAKKAESEGLVVIDDPSSILRCTNKVYLADLMHSHGIPVPRTYALQKRDLADISRMEKEIGYPMVLKIPDGAFSRGVTKVANAAQLNAVASELLQQSSLVLVQEYLYTEFDWRIGVLNRKPIFASQYFMSKGHWQVAKRDAQGNAEFGMAASVPLDAVPADLLAYATQAANLIGDGLYGVDMKMTTRGPVLIEVNDNPNIDAGGEDGVLGEQLYRMVLGDLVRRLDLMHAHALGGPKEVA